jgi:hypothetical protein
VLCNRLAMHASPALLLLLLPAGPASTVQRA